MSISNHRVSAHRADHVSKFFVKGGTVTRATVTILAEDLDIAWNMVHALFPGSDLSDTEVQHNGRHYRTGCPGTT